MRDSQRGRRDGRQVEPCLAPDGASFLVMGGRNMRQQSTSAQIGLNRDLAEPGTDWRRGSAPPPVCEAEQAPSEDHLQGRCSERVGNPETSNQNPSLAFSPQCGFHISPDGRTEASPSPFARAPNCGPLARYGWRGLAWELARWQHHPPQTALRLKLGQNDTFAQSSDAFSQEPNARALACPGWLLRAVRPSQLGRFATGGASERVTQAGLKPVHGRAFRCFPGSQDKRERHFQRPENKLD